MHTTVYSGAILGIDGEPVEVEVDIARGIPCFSIVGLPNTAVRESHERVTAALKNAGSEFPLQRITVNLAPADIKKEGSAFASSQCFSTSRISGIRVSATYRPPNIPK